MAKVTKKTILTTTYPGPSLEKVLTFSDVKVSKEMKRLHIEPQSRPMTFYDDPLDEGLDATQPPATWTHERIAEVERQADELHHRCLRGQLFSGYLHEWLATLDEKQLWAIVEDFEKETVSLSERRYTSRAKLCERAGWVVYASEHKRTVQLPLSPKEEPMTCD